MIYHFLPQKRCCICVLLYPLYFMLRFLKEALLMEHNTSWSQISKTSRPSFIWKLAVLLWCFFCGKATFKEWLLSCVIIIMGMLSLHFDVKLSWRIWWQIDLMWTIAYLWNKQSIINQSAIHLTPEVISLHCFIVCLFVQYENKSWFKGAIWNSWKKQIICHKNVLPSDRFIFKFQYWSIQFIDWSVCKDFR